MRLNRIGTVLAAIAVAFAVAGLSLATLNAAPQEKEPDKEKTGQGVASVARGF